MVLKRSNTRDFPLGKTAPPFNLPEPLTGTTVSLASAAGPRGTLVAFLSCHCPFVMHIQPALRALIADLSPQGVTVVGISVNDVARYPDDAPEHMAALARTKLPGLRFLYDESQETAKAYAAQCTPDFYLFDAELKLVYRGRLDASSPGNRLASDARDMRAAVQCLVEGREIQKESIMPSMGCSIKWKPGNEPRAY